MSSELATQFAEKHSDKYAEVLSKWADKVDGSVSNSLQDAWGKDLHEALAEALIEDLVETSGWGELNPSKELRTMYSQIAAKYALSYATSDLLIRLAKSVKEDKANPAVITADGEVSGRIVRPSELIKRSAQTVAQIYDMAKDSFNAAVDRALTRNNMTTGNRRWVVVNPEESRHADMHHQIRAADQPFFFKKQKVNGPRPVKGNPADWSNCSCYLEYQTAKGKWLRVTH